LQAYATVIPIPINFLACGEIGRVEQLLGCIDDVRRLEEMGIRRGQEVQMVQPGSPCIVRVGSSRLCFRQAEGVGVMVVAETPGQVPAVAIAS
jgi:Fe2+ transport system protein FeoA